MIRYKSTESGLVAFTAEEEAEWDVHDQEVALAKIEEAKVAYKGKRAAEYPAIADYLDGIVKGDTAQVQTYIDACLAVKVKYPKPE